MKSRLDVQLCTLANLLLGATLAIHLLRPQFAQN
jgi:hypothetical protein